jgi:chromosome segregation ATPase
MTTKDLKQIKDIFDEKLEPIKTTLDEHTRLLNEHTRTLDKHSEKLQGITDHLVDVSEGVTEIKEALKSHDKRMSTVEDSLDLPSPIR